MVDTSVLVGELLRAAGRERIADERLELFLPEATWGETQVELPRRVTAFARRHTLSADLAASLTAACLEAARLNISLVGEAVYAAIEDEGRARSVRDPRDWPVVACAIVLSGGIWTNDNDFLGVGLPTWTTVTLPAWLDRHPEG